MASRSWSQWGYLQRLFIAGTASRRGAPSVVDLVPHVTGRSCGPSLLAIFADPSVLRDAARRVLASPIVYLTQPAFSAHAGSGR